MRCGGIVLTGGKSSRMGTSKAMLPFGPELMLQRIVRLLGQVVEPIAVVAAADQPLPPLPSGIIVAHDRRPERGPLEGLAAGLAALEGGVEAAYATSCDVPLLAPDFVGRLIALAGDFDVVVPRTGGYHHPLAALYRLSVRPHIEALLAEDRLRPVFLFERVRAREVSAEELTDVDPALDTLKNLNYPEDYRAALAQAGFGEKEEGGRRKEE